jgi:hypothetical protein
MMRLWETWFRLLPGFGGGAAMIAALRKFFWRLKNVLSWWRRDRGHVHIPPVAEEPVTEELQTKFVTYPSSRSSFEKAGRLIMCPDGLAIYSDIDDRVCVLLNGDIDAVLNGDKREIRLLGSQRRVVGTARRSASGKALNFSIGAVYYTVPMRSVLAVLDGRNRKAAVFVGK